MTDTHTDWRRTASDYPTFRTRVNVGRTATAVTFDATVEMTWSGTPSWDSSGNVMTMKPNGNGNLAAGASTTFGFLGSWTGTNSVPTLSCTANGSPTSQTSIQSFAPDFRQTIPALRSARNWMSVLSSAIMSPSTALISFKSFVRTASAVCTFSFVEMTAY